MRILVLTQIVPFPADAGPKIKTQYALRTLAQEHAVEVISFVRDADEAEAARELERWCERVVTVPLRRSKAREPYYAARGWLGGTPFLVQRDARAAFVAAVRDRLAVGDVDVVHADQLSMAQYLPLGRRAGAHTVFDAHNAVWQLVRELVDRQPTPLHRAASRVEWRLLRRFEGRAARESDLTLTVSAADERALADAAGGPVRSAVVPIGIEARDRRAVTVRTDAHHLLSVATMHYPPNQEALRWFRDEIWPLTRAAAPRAVVDVVGSRPPADLVAWADDDPAVTVHGYVSNITPLYERAAAFIVPLRAGSGTRVKILEAMAAGVPVVSTSVGADGLDVEPGTHLLIADEPSQFAEAVASLLASPERRCALANAARAHVIERYDWRACCRPLLDAYSELESSNSPRRTVRAAPDSGRLPAFPT